MQFILEKKRRRRTRENKKNRMEVFEVHNDYAVNPELRDLCHHIDSAVALI